VNVKTLVKSLTLKIVRWIPLLVYRERYWTPTHYHASALRKHQKKTAGVFVLLLLPRVWMIHVLALDPPATMTVRATFANARMIPLCPTRKIVTFQRSNRVANPIPVVKRRPVTRWRRGVKSLMLVANATI
jgi:hypothetical protein